MEYSLKDLLEKYMKISDKYTINDLIYLCTSKLNLSKEYLMANINDLKLNKENFNNLNSDLKKLYFENIPLNYIIGNANFYNENYIVNKNVLVPRADSEILVEEAINYINSYKLKSMIDMCTGTGCIGISISNNSLVERSLLVDISPEALEVAKKNIKRNNAVKCKTVKSDLFKNIDRTLKFDLLVSNPPYIATSEIHSLDKEVKNEPLLALDGGKDGLDVYRKIFCELNKYLNDKAFILLEIGYNQNEMIKKLISNYGYIEYIETKKDLSGNDRVVICRFHQI